MRRRFFYASGFSWSELQNQTWRGWRFWAIDSNVPRIHALSSKTTIQSFLQQFLKEQLLDQSLKFRTWKFLSRMDLKLQFHHPMIHKGHVMFWFPEERVGSWRKFIFPKPGSDQVQNYSLNPKNPKEEDLAWHSRRLAFWKLVQPMFKVQLATRTLARTPSAFLPAKRPISHKPFLRPRGIGKLFLPILRMEELCQ